MPLRLGTRSAVAAFCGWARLGAALTRLLAGLPSLARGGAAVFLPVLIPCATAFAASGLLVLVVALRLLRACGRRHGKQGADHHREKHSLAVTVHCVSPGWVTDRPRP